LNRAIAISKVSGARQALDELEKIESEPAFKTYHLFYSTKAEFFIQNGDYNNAVISLENAIGLAPLPSVKGLLEKRRQFCMKERKI